MPIRLSTTHHGVPVKVGQSESVLVVPTRRRVRHLTRELVAQRYGASTEYRIYTLEQLAGEIVQCIFGDLRIVEDPILTLLFNQAITSSAQSLVYFKHEGKQLRIPRGTFERIVAVIRKLKEVGVYPEALAEEIQLSGEEEQPKLRDVVAIYSAYESALAELGGVDAEGIFKTLHLNCPQGKFDSAFRRLFPHAAEIAIVGFDEFTEPEMGFVQKLCALNVGVSLVFDFEHGNPALFGHLEQNYRRFLELGFSEIKGEAHWFVFPSEPSGPAGAAIRRIASRLFQREADEDKAHCAQLITVAKAQDRVREIELICKLIKQRVSIEPAPDLSRICVAFYRPQLYTQLVREQFQRFGIPVNITDRFDLAQSGVVSAIVGLLDVRAKNFLRNDVVRTLGSSYFEFRNGVSEVDRANVASVSLELRITAGVQLWRKKIERQIERVERQKLISTRDDESNRAVRDINRLKKAKSDIDWLDNVLSDVGCDQTPSEFEASLLHMLDTLEVSRCIVSGRDHNVIEKDARAYAKFLEVVGQLTRLLEYQEGRSRQHSLKSYVEQLKAALLQERYNVQEHIGEGVLVTSIDETRGLPMNIMFVAGLVDGEFPSNYQSEVFFSSQRLKEREVHHTWENRYLFYQAVTNWSEHLYLTYPQQDAELDLVRSSFVDSLANICDVEEWAYPGNSPVDDILHSQYEYLREHGRRYGSGANKKLPVPDGVNQRQRFIERAIRIEQGRTKMEELEEYRGEIFVHLSQDAKEQLEQLKHRVYSVSQLETYGKCPFQFFAQRLLQLNVVEDFEEAFSPLEKGSVLHEVLFEFYSARREHNCPSLINCSETDFGEALQQLLAIAERKLDEIDIPDAFWDLEKELILGDKDSGKGYLREFLEFERHRKTAWHPDYFEVGFGSRLGGQTRIDRTLSSEEPIVAGAVQLRGKIDRVDLGDDAFAVIDYKTGSSIPKLSDIREGLSLQLPIYLYTMEKMLARHRREELIPAAGLYYQIRSRIDLKTGVGNLRFKEKLGIKSKASFLPSDEELRALIDDAIGKVNAYVQEIAQGRFPLTSTDKIERVCTYCDYKTVCRIQSTRRVEQAKEE